jgi:hypothetical protein
LRENREAITDVKPTGAGGALLKQSTSVKVTLQVTYHPRTA